MTILDRQLENKNLSNAYIIEGDSKEYNLEFSLDFVAKVFKSLGVNLDLKKNPDFTLIDKDPIDIKTVRGLIKDMVIRPYNKKIKIYLIHGAENLRVESSNAMLKSLEELREYTLVIFTCRNSQSLLETIRSRCQIVSIKSDEKNYSTDLRKLSDIVAKVFKGRLEEYFKNKVYLLNFKDDKESITSCLNKIFSDLLKFKYHELKSYDKTYLYNIKSLENISFNSLRRILEKIYIVEKSFKNNTNYELSIENIFLNIYKEGSESQ